MTLSRPPIAPLRPFVRTVWATRETGAVAGGRERVLPTGAVHVVFRTDPLRLFADEDDQIGRLVGDALVGGPRTAYYVRDAAPPGYGVGALLHPGAASLLLGVPASELAEQHVRLDDLWGTAAVAEARERILAAPTPEGRLAAFEAVLRARLPAVRGIDPAIAAALAAFHHDHDASITSAVERSGYTHGRFIARFRESVGMTPKLYCRIQRFQRAVALAGSATPLALAALDAGYADQSHLTREFRAIAGVSPGEYRTLAPLAANHVPLRRQS